MIWHPEACLPCFKLVMVLINDQAKEESIQAAKSTLRQWVSGYARNAPSGCPYVLDINLGTRLFPGSPSASVSKDVATPIIEAIRAAMAPPPEDQHLSGDVAAAINIHLEPMDEQVSGELIEAGSHISPTPSSSSSFCSFENPTSTPWDGSRSVRPKVKPLEATKPLPKVIRSAPPAASELSLAPSETSPAAKVSLPTKGRRNKSAKTKAAEIDNQALSDILAEQLRPLKEMIAGLLHSRALAATSTVPDASKLPPFDKNNPWRFALHAPYRDGKLTFEGLGTRPLEDFEFYPENLQFPFNGFVRLTENALVRVDKVPKETVIFPKEQAQAVWARTLAEWDCVNTRLTPHKGSFTIFTTPKEVPTPFTDKITELTLQAISEEKPMPILKETEATSLLMPATREFWHDAPSTFTVGKLDSDCASTLFSDKLPKLPENLLKTEFETKTRLARSINAVTSLELVASMYKDEQLFQVLTKSLLQTFQSDLFEFAAARRVCRKYVLAEASIRHEPNRLIKSSIWGKNLFPQEEVDNVLKAASSTNQSLRVRWGLPSKRKFKTSGKRPKSKKKQRYFAPYKVPQPQQLSQPIPLTQMSKPSTSKAQPQQQFVLLQAPHGPQAAATTAWMASPAFNPVVYEAGGSFRGYNRQSARGRARGQSR
ncbi:uncharacterized protein LOC135211750 [Macrobrachium nipponense]|uniref:uncharacterized protein LOC135211750 n=1 Tax=Macrobrachium nipponense TaxID=159736 RepID=UPI0030C8540B